MADKKTETEAAAKTPKAKPEKAAATPVAEEKPEKTESSAKSKKINKMTSSEIQAKLEGLKTTPGGMQTKYAQHLLHRMNAIKK